MRAQEVVSGAIVIESKGSLSHQGIQLVMEGNTTLQLSAKSVGLFEAFYNSLKPIQVRVRWCVRSRACLFLTPHTHRTTRHDTRAG